MLATDYILNSVARLELPLPAELGKGARAETALYGFSPENARNGAPALKLPGDDHLAAAIWLMAATSGLARNAFRRAP